LKSGKSVVEYNISSIHSAIVVADSLFKRLWRQPFWLGSALRWIRGTIK